MTTGYFQTSGIGRFIVSMQCVLCVYGVRIKRRHIKYGIAGGKGKVVWCGIYVLER